MKRALIIGAAAALSALVGDAALAGVQFGSSVQFGRPDYSNYLSRPRAVTCDWQYPNYFRACPTPHPPELPAAAPTYKSGQS